MTLEITKDWLVNHSTELQFITSTAAAIAMPAYLGVPLAPIAAGYATEAALKSFCYYQYPNYYKDLLKARDMLARLHIPHGPKLDELEIINDHLYRKVLPPFLLLSLVQSIKFIVPFIARGYKDLYGSIAKSTCDSGCKVISNIPLMVSGKFTLGLLGASLLIYSAESFLADSSTNLAKLITGYRERDEKNNSKENVFSSYTHLATGAAGGSFMTGVISYAGIADTSYKQTLVFAASCGSSIIAAKLNDAVNDCVPQHSRATQTTSQPQQVLA